MSMPETPDTPLRRSKRARKQINYNDDAGDEHGPSHESHSSRPPASEEKKRTVRMKRGLLQRIKEFPLDVVFDIFSHLTPHDLLNLSRTSKDLRKLLLSRSTTSVWRLSRSNVSGLPECPDDMSEPAYAHLCFDLRCHHCEGKQPAVNMLWHCRTRSCHACLEGPFYTTEQLDYDYPHGIIDQSFYPTDMNLDLWALIRHRGDTVRKEHQNYVFYCPASLKRELTKANHDISGWRAKKIEEGEKVHENAQQLAKWWKTVCAERQADLQRRRKEREDAILQRLADSGWAEELAIQKRLNGLRVLREFKLGSQAKKLTDKDWNELEPKLEEALEKAKESRLAIEFREKCWRRYVMFKDLLTTELNKLPWNTIGPNVFDLAGLPECRQFLSMPIEHELTRADLVDLISSLPEIRAKWIDDRQKDLINLLKTHGIRGVTSNTLYHASTIFVCKTCRALCVYPRPLMHHCRRANTLLGKVAQPSFQHFMDYMCGKAWDIGGYSFDETLSRRAQGILEACGLPPNATVDQVKDSECWLEPRDSRSDGQVRTFFPAARAMYQGLRDRNRPEENWTIANEQDTTRAIATSIRPCSVSQVMCKHCLTLVSGPCILDHLKDEHNLTRCMSKDVELPVDAQPFALHHHRVDISLVDTNHTE
ncbi:hypothetical protein V5O48_015221 [Marasmius crinis-equi]|uniref:F-box domain-containing protein n=1 Tax=Marasmius crinis-equi TaxID=585013 RepID=A0ABR3EV56_9AGAR